MAFDSKAIFVQSHNKFLNISKFETTLPQSLAIQIFCFIKHRAVLIRTAQNKMI